MLLWAGLGNPEPSMCRQRHNIGFMAVGAIARRYGFAPWRSRFKGETAEGRIGAHKVMLLRPMTYMNLSGESVQEAMAFYKISPENLTAFHDELDLVPGKVRVKRGGGAAGHNGLRSIDKMIGTPDYWRVRLGIGHPGARERVNSWVLGNFSEAERQEWLDSLLERVADAAPLLADGKLDKFTTEIALPEGNRG
ncbi:MULTISPECIES: aminoacyl-tRNA hydrolase [Acetobacter]|uniref:aminoacyl-tRNA hydrolase n=1 Tax=Acetobacter TaxID=434 RepID=UPI000A3B7E20|nr:MULTISPECIES: aminoacyl-tRNA hydrolase [Acetobacter]MBS0986277.1 aminoacyl-tRNA hydrolase [Acetobacter thailandicus]MBS1003051.1 aminoacyl-tRNA hydrolase [Acetobacter thailandicus]OUI87564.1 peptidyl-tRNA hydrolase [Acetobacter sp. DmW_043]OUJ10967.1 peptidyl-tRNA hydrolase [Acetobacter sp. DsW_059]